MEKNWEVDIAANLEQYLQELQVIDNADEFEEGETNLNFADAAMLLQGSAFVYSKKVEYLYSELQRVRELLTNKNRPKQKSSVDQDGNDEDMADFEELKQEFLSLDDIPSSKKHHVKEDFDQQEDFKFLQTFPTCLLPHDEANQTENPLLSKTGEVLASRFDFTMNTGSLHMNGALLIDQSFSHLTDTLIPWNPTMDTAPDGVPEKPIKKDAGREPPDVEHIFEDVDDDVEDAVPPMDVSDPGQTSPVEEVRDALRRTERERRPVTREVQVQKVAVKADPWAMLDPFEEVKVKKPPSRKASVIKLCPGLEEQETNWEERARQLEHVCYFLDRALYSNQSKYPRQKYKCPTYPELDTLFWAEYKRRRALDEEAKKLARMAIYGDAEEEDLERAIEEQEEIDISEDEQDALDLEPLVDDNLFIATNNPDEPNSLHDHLASSDEEDFEERCLNRVKDYLASADTHTVSSELSKRIEEWEENILPRLEEEEQRAPFDINVYGKNILDHLQANPESTNFTELVLGKPVYEICRIFLASLMLANTRNVEIHSNEELKMDSFQLHLLTTRRHFEELQEYQAPSTSRSQK